MPPTTCPTPVRRMQRAPSTSTTSPTSITCTFTSD
jgi:hypothetical protein